MKLTCRPGSGMSRSAVKISTDADAPGATFPTEKTCLCSVAPCHNGSIQDSIVHTTLETNRKQMLQLHVYFIADGKWTHMQICDQVQRE